MAKKSIFVTLKLWVMSDMNDIFGTALLDYQKGHYTEDICTFSSLDEEDTIRLPYLFRQFKNMPHLEQKALQHCTGSVLDIGCGAGSHSLYLQQNGYRTTALDSSRGAIETCRLRGIEHMVHKDILNFEGQKFDTLLMLMNGIGIAGKLKKLNNFFDHLKTLLNPSGQILLDSSDIRYMFDQDEDGGLWVPDWVSYYGEVEFTLHYKGHKTEPFFWLYVDYRTLERTAMASGLHCELVSIGTHFDYLAKLWVK